MSQFKTIKTIIETELKEKGSLFIAKAAPVKDAAEAEEYIKLMKRDYYNATHHCSAYRIFPGDEKYSDDGEPSGTAGIRILNAIDHFDLFNLVLVVIRNFGGTKLGVGLLGKTYYKSAFSALEISKSIIVKEYVEGKIIHNFEETSIAHKLLNDYNASIILNSFEEKPAIIFHIESDKTENFKKEFLGLNPEKIKLELKTNLLYL